MSTPPKETHGVGTLATLGSPESPGVRTITIGAGVWTARPGPRVPGREVVAVRVGPDPLGRLTRPGPFAALVFVGTLMAARDCPPLLPEITVD
ncbi:MAG: hypothetical protein ACK48N_12850, partial [Planctomyces sp.]